MTQPTARLTADGSHTLATTEGILYHSHHGAVQESRYIFLEAGLTEAARVFPQEELRILEIGFGTGLNAFLTALEAETLQRSIHYTAAELHPIPETLAATLNYPELLGHAGIFGAIHAAPWEESGPVTKYFSLRKLLLDASSQSPPAGSFHAVFFDAFSPENQLELWTTDVFARVHKAMQPGGVLTTYCSKSAVRRAMQAAGFAVEKLAGPFGKREIVRARKAV